MGKKTNWPLLLGALIVLLVALLAVAGPFLAPHDPLEENAIIRSGDNWFRPPLPAFEVPGYLLGTDGFGRDLFSRVLWAVRPTMVMVSIVASIRLLLGVWLGLAAGWSGGRLGRLLDGAISGALSIPVLMVALCAIAAIGVELGIWAFIFGLAITGWAETARIVREQTRIIKGQLYVEAAQALGVSNLNIVRRHVLRQIMPMVWMLLAFEISSTLMVTAGLGFLGYYIGGDVWVEFEDFVARRLTGMPELGQMLSTVSTSSTSMYWTILSQPWPIVIVGTIIFATVLGFNLLGEGLQRQLNVHQTRRDTLLVRIGHSLQEWTLDTALPAVSGWSRRRAVRIGAAGLLVAGVASALVYWQIQSKMRSEDNPTIPLVVPGDHLWATERHDHQGTLWTDAIGPQNPQVHWAFRDETQFSGGPAVAADGTVFIASEGGTLYALDPEGNLLWRQSLPASACRSPALDAQGDVYVTDKEGNLSRFSAQGQLVWRFEPTVEAISTTGPVVAPDGRIYYGLGGAVQAVSTEGQGLWRTAGTSGRLLAPPALTPSGDLLFYMGALINTADGSVRPLDLPTGADQYMVGADGRTYLRTGNTVMQWRTVDGLDEIVQVASWDYRDFLQIANTPRDAGIAGRSIIWLFYTNLFNTRLAWLQANGQMIGTATYRTGGASLVAVDSNATAYTCMLQGTFDHPSVGCMAFEPDVSEPLWQTRLEGERIKGSALVPGRLYVVTENMASNDEGLLYALEDAQP